MIHFHPHMHPYTHNTHAHTYVTYVYVCRLKEIKNEMLHSVKLKAHFEDNPRELDLLKHDKALRPSKVQRHLSAIPSYLVPTSLKVRACAEIQTYKHTHTDSINISEACAWERACLYS